MVNGFLFSDIYFALASFANSVSAVRLLTNQAGLLVSTVALNNEPHVFSVVLRHLVFPVAELITSKFLTVSVCKDVSEIFMTEEFLSLSETMKLQSSSSSGSGCFTLAT